VPLQTEEDAFDQLNTHAGGCVPTPSGGCVTLVATSVTLDEITIRTSRGDARVPAWLFVVDGIGARVARVAVAPSAIGKPPSPAIPTAAPSDFIGASALVSTTGTTLVFQITHGSCELGFAPLVYEDAHTVGGRLDGHPEEGRRLRPDGPHRAADGHAARTGRRPPS